VTKKLKVAIVQDSPVPLAIGAGLDKAIAKAREAIEKGARVIAFGEGFLGGYPAWLEHVAPARLWDHPGTRELHALLRKDWPQAEFNIEGNPFHNLMDFVRELRPHQCTFVPDSEGQFTSDHGWDLRKDGERVRPLIAEAKALGVRVSLFMDADPEAMPLAKAVGADRIELYTEPYAAAWGTPRQREQLQRFAAAAKAAQACGLGINAGHDLSRDNLPDFLRAVPGVQEVSIGHALVADALELGYAATIHAYLDAIARGTVASKAGE